MAFKKRNYRRRARPYRRVNKTKKLVTGHGPTMLEKIASGIGGVATVARAVLPAISAINTEEKFLDIGTTLTSLTSGTPSIANLNQMATGTTESTRIGNSILAKNLNMKMGFKCNWAAAANGSGLSRFRITIFCDKSQAGSAPTTAQLFQDNTNMMSAFNKNYTDRFVILKDKYINANRMATPFSTGTVNQYYSFKYFKALEYHIRYIGSTAVVADLGQNALYYCIWFVGDTNVTGQYESYSRLNFTDN